LPSPQTAAELNFEAPGPGSWSLDPVQFPRPATRYFVETQPEPFARGAGEFPQFYGMLVGGMQYSFVNGFPYGTMRPVPDEEVPARIERAGEVFERKLWREQLRDWDETFKPASIKTHRELQSVDPDALDDAELVEYLTRCRDHHIEMIYQHMRFTGAAMLPIGDLLVNVLQWTDVPPAELLSMMRGSAPVSAGASAELEQLIAALKADSDGRELLHSDADPAEILERLRSLDNDTGRAASAYLDLVGCRLLDGFDISGRYALELPDALIRAIRASVDRDPDEPGDDDRVAEVRSKVPADKQAQFDEMLGEARLMYRIRDERGVFSDIWASGIMRRAVLGGGRRLADRGRIHDPEHFIDAGFDEMRSLLTDGDGPSADELAERYETRTSLSAKDAPATLGPPPPPRPDPSGLPPAAARVMAAVGFAIDALFGSSEEEHEEDMLRGLAASGGVY